MSVKPRQPESPPPALPDSFPIALNAKLGDGKAINPQAAAHFELFKFLTPVMTGVLHSLPQHVGIQVTDYSPFSIRQQLSKGGGREFLQYTFVVQVSSRTHAASHHRFRLSVVCDLAGKPTFEIDCEIPTQQGAVELRRELDELFKWLNMAWSGQERKNAYDAKAAGEILDDGHSRLLKLIPKLPNYTPTPENQLHLALVEFERLQGEIEASKPEHFDGFQIDTWERGRKIFSQLKVEVNQMLTD